MSLKKNKNGTYKIASIKELKEAVSLREDYLENIQSAESDSDEVKEYLDMKQEVDTLKIAVQEYLVETGTKEIEHDGVRAVIIKGQIGTWSKEKLRKILTKSEWLKVTTYEIDKDKLDEAVKAGTIDEKKIQGAYVTVEKKPYIRFFYSASDEGEESESLAAALGQ
jgi:hypothetical protein